MNNTIGRMPILEHPPLAPLAFRVGVVGHRPNRLKHADLPALGDVIGGILGAVKEAVHAFHAGHGGLYAPAAPALRAVTPLAEGSDRVFAEQAVARGFELVCPLPFPQSEYEEDFAPGKASEPGSLDRFRALLAGPTGVTTFELDGTRSADADPYGAAGRVVLNQSDLLLAVWDGLPAQGRGGTVGTLEEAIAYRVPVVWIDAHAPHRWQLGVRREDLPREGQTQRCQPKGVANPDLIRHVVVEALSPPVGPESAPGCSRPALFLREAFFLERKSPVNFGCLWKPFRNLLGDSRWTTPELGVPAFEEAVEKDWPVAREEMDPADQTRLRPDHEPIAFLVNARLRPYYAWSDKLADYYADAYRTSYLLAYFLTVLAVCLALLPLGLAGNAEAQSEWDSVFIAGEFVAVTWLLGMVLLGNWRHWHERWMEYRLIAELVRQVRFLVPLGGGRPFPSQPEHLRGWGDPAETWMYWYVRSMHRAVGLPSLRLTAEVRRECLEYLQDVVKGQVAFHHKTAQRSERIERRLHRAGLFLFGLTAVIVAVHFLPHALGWIGVRIEWAPALSRVLAMACGALPAMGGALAAVNNHGEFMRLAKRSRGMKESLQAVLKKIDEHLSNGGAASDTIVRIAAVAAKIMVDEVLDWRVIFQDRRLIEVL